MATHLAKVYAAELDGIDARPIEVEVDVHVGLHAFTIVGLADKALNEAKERVNAALKNAGVKPPNRENRKITVNLAPADVKKTGTQYDLAIAIGYLLATDQVRAFAANEAIIVGELALDGALRPLSGALNIALMAKALGFRSLYLPAANAHEALAVRGISLYPLNSLSQAIAVFEKREVPAPLASIETNAHERNGFVDSASIKGQEHAKRALMIAAAGGHHCLMIGSPGAGKSALARSLICLLPPLTEGESLEVTRIYSAIGKNPDGRLRTVRPFRGPHHTASTVALIGGGAEPKPGEISLAHRGVLFLDELPEFQRAALEALREPIEQGEVHIARAKGSLIFPARFMLIAAMNPCPCGFDGDEARECRCSANEVTRYTRKVSGPVLDRIDLQITVPRTPLALLRSPPETQAQNGSGAKLVERIRRTQQERFARHDRAILTNSEMTSRDVETLIKLHPDTGSFMTLLQKSQMSPRGYYRLLKTARTIADLEASYSVKKEHLAEAFSYRLPES